MAGSRRVTLFCATSNKGKLAEFRQAAGHDLAIEGLAAADCLENGDTFEENAVSKALCYSTVAPKIANAAGGQPLYVFADDSGLEVDALGGAPGIYSARFDGLDASDAANNRLLLDRLSSIPEARRTARFVCWIALARDGKILKTFDGKAEGRILDAPLGSGGFGYDPLFFYPPLARTFAELPAAEKWSHSHRGKAFRRMMEWLRETEL